MSIRHECHQKGPRLPDLQLPYDDASCPDWRHPQIALKLPRTISLIGTFFYPSFWTPAYGAPYTTPPALSLPAPSKVLGIDNGLPS